MLLTHALLSGCTSYLVTILVTMQRCNFGYCILNQVACVRTTSLSATSTTCYQVLITSIMLLPVVMCISYAITITMLYQHSVHDLQSSNRLLLSIYSLYLYLSLIITIVILYQGCYRPPVTPHTENECALNNQSLSSSLRHHLSTNQFPCCSYCIDTHALGSFCDRDLPLIFLLCSLHVFHRSHTCNLDLLSSLTILGN